MADWNNCRNCSAAVELDERPAGQWRTPDGKEIHLNGRCADCRSKGSRGGSDYVGLFWRHVADPKAPFSSRWEYSSLHWDDPAKNLTPCGCPEFIPYFWPGDR